MGDSSWPFSAVISTGLGRKSKGRQKAVLSAPSWIGTLKGFQNINISGPQSHTYWIWITRCAAQKKNKVFVVSFKPSRRCGDSEASPPLTGDDPRPAGSSSSSQAAPRLFFACVAAVQTTYISFLPTMIFHSRAPLNMLIEFPVFCTSSFSLNKFYSFFILSLMENLSSCSPASRGAAYRNLHRMGMR